MTRKINIILLLSLLILLSAGCSKKEDLLEEELLNTRIKEDQLNLAKEDSKNGYSYNQLNQMEQKVYLEIYCSILEMNEFNIISATDSDMIEKAFNCVMNDHPELFYINGYVYTEYQINNNLYLNFSGKYIYSPEEKIEKEKEIELKTAFVLNNINKLNTDYDKTKYIYEYVITNTEYVASSEDNQNILSVMINKESVCQGYAKTVQYLLDKAGVKSVFLTGYTINGIKHAWNMVYLDNKPYFIDATWGDGVYQTEEDEKEEINYDYFCFTSDSLSKTHIIENVVNIPECTSMEMNYYVKEGLYFEDYDEEKIRTLFAMSQENTKKPIKIKCNNEDTFKLFADNLITNKGIFNLIDNGEEVLYTYNADYKTFTFYIGSEIK